MRYRIYRRAPYWYFKYPGGWIVQFRTFNAVVRYAQWVLS